MPVFQVEDYLATCLHSILDGDWPVEVIVVDDGSTDGSAGIARRFARRDRRVRYVRQPNRGLSAARNAGVRHATAEYLAFIDSDDLIVRAAWADAVEALHRSGSDLALLEYTQVKGDRLQPVAPWIRRIHAPGARTTTLAAEPEVSAQTTAWSKIYRRAFWDAAGLSFREGALFEDQDSTAEALVAARAIDVRPGVAYHYRVRPGSIMRRADLGAVHQFFDAIDRALTIYQSVPGVRVVRASQVLSNDAPRMLRDLVKSTAPDHRDALMDRVTALLAEPDLDLAEAPAEARVVYALLRAGRPADVTRFVERGGFDLASLCSDEVDRQPALVFPFTGDPDVPGETRILSERQTPLDATVLRARLDEDGLRLTVAAWLRHVDAAERPTCRAWLRDITGWEREFTVAPADEFIGHRVRTTRRSNEDSVWDLSLVLPDLNDVDSSQLIIELTHGGRTRRERVSRIDPNGSAAVPQQAGILALTGEEPWELDCEDVKPWKGDLVDPAAIEIPAEEGEHLVPGLLDHALALQLPWDFELEDRQGYLAVASRRRLKVVVQPKVPREQLTVWWQRDHGDRP